LCGESSQLTSDIRIRRGLKRAESIANNENGGTEATKGAVQDAWPGNERANTVEAEPPDEDGLVTVVPEDPIGMAEGRQWVCTLETK
jgi:hypothetical protein